MATVHLLHGFNVSDGGKGSVGHLSVLFEALGYDVILHNYGWTGPFFLRLKNASVVDYLKDKVKPEDHIVGHSNGCYIAWSLIEEGVKCKSVVCIQPALRRDTVWGDGVENILCLYNDKDWAVRAGQWWRYLTYLNPLSWKDPHEWGAAGYFSFTTPDERLTQWKTNDPTWKVPASGHSGIFSPKPFGFWGNEIANQVHRY